MNRAFQKEWADKVRRVRASAFWREVSQPPALRLAPPGGTLRRDEVAVDGRWALDLEGPVCPNGPATAGAADLRAVTEAAFGFRFAVRPAGGPRLVLELAPSSGRPAGRWERAFTVDARPDGIRVKAGSEGALLRASLFLSNDWRLRRRPSLPVGRRRIRPAVPIHIGADLWGGFCTTQAWIAGREDDANFIELARVGVTHLPVMTLLEDYLADAPPPFRSLVNAQATANRRRLARLVESAGRHDIAILLMAYNPKLPPDHPVFRAHPPARGAVQSKGAFRVLCSSELRTRRFLEQSWASLFEAIPQLGGMLAITGGEGFYHCFMRNSSASDCPRCSRRPASDVVAELVNGVGAAIRAKSPEALMVVWPYSAHWSGDRDQAAWIDRLDPRHILLQTEVDKDSVDWRPAGYGNHLWDYSMSGVSISDRCRRQRARARRRGLSFSVKIECGNAIECLSVPWIPALENQAAIWSNACRLKPRAIQSRWLFDGSCKNPSEELGYWLIWGRGAGWDRPDAILNAIARRDFGDAAAPAVRKAWRCFSDALRHHPCLHYYTGSYFVGPAQPLVLDPNRLEALDPVFFGRFYWQWETQATRDRRALETAKPLFFVRPAFRAEARRGPDAGRDVGLRELETLARLWERGVRHLAAAGRHVPPACRARYRREWILGRHLALTWRSAATVEAFLRLRDTIRAFSGNPVLRAGHWRENRRDLLRLERMIRSEQAVAREDGKLIRGVDFLDLSLRLDMGAASLEAMLKAKQAQLDRLLRIDLPAWRKELRTW